ncbi:MAG: gliding motility-associated C-terminal domain-containing protein, partial [Cytophagaceae bacterium]|nr:gliding motility-associated C-terminal domain-containing protein [Cytophagaceae bacterium]MDW8455915.1 gliding motility-associated C-terminal domain-containing protein [Cytophagaceae bacterium]
GTGTWSVISGTGNIANPNNPNSAVTGLVAGDLVLQWTISNAPCPSNSSQVTIHVDNLTPPVFSTTGVSYDTCANTTGITYTTTIDRSSTSTYLWSVTGTLSIVAQSGNSITINTGPSGGNIHLTETYGACNLTVSKPVTIKSPISPPNAGPDRVLCVNTVNMDATPVSGGTGMWTVTSGSGTFANPNNPKTTVTGLSSGLNVFTWTAYGCGGPLIDDVAITYGASDIQIAATGPTDTVCTGTQRTLQVSATGGSGQYMYVWSSDNGFYKTGNEAIITITQDDPKTTYYVYAIDALNSGCESPKDTVVLHATSSQELIIPNVITPNDDNKNDYWSIQGTGVARLLPGSEVEVVNRWGDIVYRNSNYDNTWKADNLSDGLYYYHIKTGCGNARYKGWLQVVR